MLILLLKAAILVDLLRVFSARGQRNYFFWIAHILIWLNVVYYATGIFVEIFACSPRAKLWNKLLPGGYCINSNTLTLASSIINVPSDILIVLLPQREIRNLHLSFQKRLRLSLVFAVAILLVSHLRTNTLCTNNILKRMRFCYYSSVLLCSTLEHKRRLIPRCASRSMDSRRINCWIPHFGCSQHPKDMQGHCMDSEVCHESQKLDDIIRKQDKQAKR